MFVRLESAPRDYAWGSTTAIASLLGRQPSGRPEAELWLGTHPGAPTKIVDPESVGGHQTLAAWVAAEPQLNFGFLLKILAAARPLSLQTHPTRAQAREGFAREERAGVPVGSSARNYKDRNHKPELIVALSPVFEALCGFRPRAEAVSALRELTAASSSEPGLGGQSTSPVESFIANLERHDDDETALAWALEWLLAGSPGVKELVAECVSLSHMSPSADAETVRQLAAEYPGDPGVLVALLLNRVRLTRGQALFLPAGNIHAYLNGLGVELMASSDNVLRGGLTSKHVDVKELVAVTRCAPVGIPFVNPRELGAGVVLYSPEIPDFALLHVQLDPSLNGGRAVAPLGVPALAICTAGEMVLSGQSSEITVKQGDFLFVTPDEGSLQFEGSGEIFIARQGISPTFGE